MLLCQSRSSGARSVQILGRRMSSVKARLPHEDRTAAEPREDDVHAVILDDIRRVNDSIKLYKLRVKDENRGIKVRIR
jgi:hypothetical protein